jgi:transketolase
VALEHIEDKARTIRRSIIEMAHRSGSPHVGSALSCADILASLYFGVLRLEDWNNRDMFILSKAHASMALYAALAAKRIMPEKALETYCRTGSTLPAHLDRITGRGIECSSGSLGHGFNIGIGVAYGLKLQRSERRTYVLVGDGESQEGSVWEGALFAPRMGLENFTAVMDCNNLQGYGRPDEICSFEPVAEKWRAFGWHVCETDGHDHAAILAAFAESSCGKPKMIVARTVKGKGVSFMEDELIWHYFIVTDGHRARALEEIG